MCECKELIDKGVCDKGFIWNLRNCECECDKSYDIGEYLDYSNCKFRKRLADELVKNVLKILKKQDLWKKLHLKMSININAVLVQCTLCYFL